MKARKLHTVDAVVICSMLFSMALEANAVEVTLNVTYDERYLLTLGDEIPDSNFSPISFQFVVELAVDTVNPPYDDVERRGLAADTILGVGSNPITPVTDEAMSYASAPIPEDPEFDTGYITELDPYGDSLDDTRRINFTWVDNGENSQPDGGWIHDTHLLHLRSLNTFPSGTLNPKIYPNESALGALFVPGLEFQILEFGETKHWDEPAGIVYFLGGVLYKGTAVVAAPYTDVLIDIKPGSDPNSINPSSRQKISVAILTTVSFDALEVFDAFEADPLSVKFGPGEATESHGRAHVKDVDRDGDMDLLLHFNTQDTGIQCGDTDATLTGMTFGGEAISGTDAIVTTNCR